MDTPTVIVPDLVGQYVHIARDQLKKLGLDIAGAEPDGVPITAATWPGLYYVTAQNPPPGSVVHRGDQVQVTYVADGNDRLDAPALTGPPPQRLVAHADPEEIETQ